MSKQPKPTPAPRPPADDKRRILAVLDAQRFPKDNAGR